MFVAELGEPVLSVAVGMSGNFVSVGFAGRTKSQIGLCAVNSDLPGYHFSVAVKDDMTPKYGGYDMQLMWTPELVGQTSFPFTVVSLTSDGNVTDQLSFRALCTSLFCPSPLFVCVSFYVYIVSVKFGFF